MVHAVCIITTHPRPCQVATYLGVQVHVSALEGLEGVAPEAGAAAPSLQRTIMLQVRYTSLL